MRTLLNANEAAEILGVSKATLAKWRCSGTGPSFVKLGLRRVAYQVHALEEFVSANNRQSTSESTPN